MDFKHYRLAWVRPQYRRVARKNGRKTNHQGNKYTLRHYASGFHKIYLDLNMMPFKPAVTLSLKFFVDTL